MKQKIRFSFPGRVYDLLLCDDKFLNEVSKCRKVENSFPRYDQWRDEDGFHISFALAGYAGEDLDLKVRGHQIILSANGLEEIIPQKEGEDSPEKKLNMHRGIVSRGIARRKFRTSLYISEEFDTSNTKADMKNGLLHIFVPEKEVKDVIVSIEV